MCSCVLEFFVLVTTIYMYMYMYMEFISLVGGKGGGANSVGGHFVSIVRVLCGL